MADINEILGRNINSIKELKQAINELQNSLIGVDAESEEFKKTSQQLAAAQAELNKVTSAGKTETDAAADSIRGLEKQYKALYDQYKLLSEEQRNSDFGKNMAQSMSDLSNKINEAKQNVGNFKDNIGRYAESATKAFQGMGISLGNLQKPLAMATTGTKTLGVALKGLAANPVGAAIMAVVVVLKVLLDIFKRVKKAINDNEEAQMRLKEAMAVFKPILDAVANAFDFLGRVVVKVVEGISKVVGAIWSLIPGMKKAIDSHKELAKATNNLTKAQRELNIENSKKEAEIERLREEASATDDVIEKKKLLEEAKQMQAEVDQKNIEIAQEELRIMEEYSKKTANSAEENEKLAAAQVKVNNAIAQGERNMRQYNKQISTLDNKTKSATSSTEDLRKKAKDLYDQTVENSKDELTKLTEKYEKEKKLLEKYHYDTTLLTRQYNKERDKIISEQFIKELAKEDANWANYTNNMTRYYNNLKQIYAGDPINLNEATKQYLEDAKIELDNLMNDLYLIYGNEKDAIQDLLAELFTDDLTKIRDYNYARELFENAFSLDDADQKKVLYQFYTFSEETWTSFVDEIQKRLKVLNETYGLDIKNWYDLVLESANGEKEFYPRANQLGYDIATNIGEGVAAGIEDFKKHGDRNVLGELNLYDMFFHMTDSNETDKFAIQEMTDRMLEEEYNMLKALEVIYQQDLENFAGTEDQKIELLKQYYEIVNQIREKDAELATLQQERTAQMFESLIDMTDRMAAAMQTYRSSQESLIDSEVKAGKISEKEAEKRKKSLLKLQAAETAFSIATITADAASGIFNIWKGYAMEKGVINPQTAAAAGIGAGPALWALNAKSLVSAIAQTASLASTAAAQIAAARGQYVTAQNNFQADTGGGSVGLAATPMLIDSTPVTYTQTVQNVDEEDVLNGRPIWVSVVDIEEGLDRRTKVTDETSF